ncbi:MAG TPA: toll/interleukin-1 receptor domain-containing protein [Sphingomicrobium sp.]|nr:toll/interleukin-1 receptor domain-containing protein [Sphingomicrobium sp.]
MADVFISYARSTARIAKAAADALSRDGFSVWMDEELPANRAYADVISERLDEAKAVLVLWSREAAESHWVRSEANRGREQAKLVQASVDGALPPMPFDQIQCADLRRWRGNSAAPAWRKLRDSIAELADQKNTAPDAGKPQRPEQPAIPRRTMIMGAGAATVVAGAGFFAIQSLREYKPPAEAEVLRQKALAIMQDGRPTEQNQAIIYLKEATRIAPDFAAAWGGLALTYALRKYQVPVAARAGEEARCRSAAQTALDLDSKEPLSHCALLLLKPVYRHWGEVEQAGRALIGRIPPLPLVFHNVGDLLVDVGRNSDSLAVYEKIERKEFLIPLSERTVIQALWNAGELQRAEERLDEVVARWPQHYAIWHLAAAFLTYTGRADEAVRMLEDASVRPTGVPDDQLDAALITARAMAGSVAPAEAIRANLKSLETGSPDVLTYLNRKLSLAQLVAQRCAALGDKDSAFALLDGYYFEEGEWARVAPVAGDMDRSTSALFEPPMKNLWTDFRFARLTRRIGLDRYWQAAGKTPDFQRKS